MKKLFTKDKKKFLIYHKQEIAKNKAPYIIFLHGLMSDMNSTKASAVETHCLERGYNFIKFDNFGHGKSAGKFTDQTISDWLEGLELIIDELTDGSVILVGSSMGAWVALLACINNPRIVGVITLAAGIDFTEELIWNNFSDQNKQQIAEKGIILVGGSDDCGDGFPISHKLIMDGRKHLLLGANIDISCPVVLIHGMNDEEVPYITSIRTAKLLKSEHVLVKLIKGGMHRLSREKDLKVVFNSIDEIYHL